MTENTDTRDPAAIERDIRRTQDEMSRTVDRIGDQLTPRNMLNALLDKAESNDIDGRMLLDGARRNPIALAMIAGGAIWLISDNDAKLPSHMPWSGRDKTPTTTGDGADLHHRDYVAHMQQVEWIEGEDPLAYQRRRDIARANFLMCERRPEEDETSWRNRLDSLTDTFREKRHAWADRGSRAAGSVSDSARSAASSVSGAASSAAHSVADVAGSAATRAQSLFRDNPLIGGLAAAAVGAILGTIVPLTETEDQQLSGMGEKARDLASDTKDQITEAVREKKDQLVDKVEQAAQPQDPAARPGQGGSSQTSHANDGGELPFQQAAAQWPPVQPGSTGPGSGQQG